MPSLSSLAGLAAATLFLVTSSFADASTDQPYPKPGGIVSSTEWPFGAAMERIDFIIETEYSLGGDYWQKLIHLTKPVAVTAEFICSKPARVEEADIWQRLYMPGTNVSFNIHPGNWCSIVGQRHAPASDCKTCFDDLRIKLRDEEDREINIVRTRECWRGKPSKADGARNKSVRLNYTCSIGRWYKGMEPWNNPDAMGYDDNGELVNPEVFIVDGPVPGSEESS